MGYGPDKITAEKALADAMEVIKTHLQRTSAFSNNSLGYFGLRLDYKVKITMYSRGVTDVSVNGDVAYVQDEAYSPNGEVMLNVTSGEALNAAMDVGGGGGVTVGGDIAVDGGGGGTGVVVAAAEVSGQQVAGRVPDEVRAQVNGANAGGGDGGQGVKKADRAVREDRRSSRKESRHDPARRG